MKTLEPLEIGPLILRAFREDDAQEVQTLAGDFEVADTTARIPHPYEDGLAEAWIEGQAKEREEGREVVFAIEEGASNRLVGAIGLVLGPQAHSAEVGYWIGKPFWNQGYATLALKGVLAFAFQTLGLERVYAHHMTRNAASGRVMEKAGMSYEGLSPKHFERWGKLEDIAFYGMLRESWRDDG